MSSFKDLFQSNLLAKWRVAGLAALLLTTLSISASAQAGIGTYDLKSPADQAFAFDYNSTGKLDHIVLYRPGTGTVFIEERVPDTNSFMNVFSSFSGIGGYDLLSTADRLMAFDYNGSGKADHILCYRPGAGTIFILENKGGAFYPVFMSFAGIAGFDLRSKADQIISFDYDGSGRYDHLVCYRPGDGVIFILHNSAGNFTEDLASFSGIAGYDLKSPADRLVAFDYYGIGTADHLVAYRPGAGVFFVLENTNGSGQFSDVQMSTAGFGGYDLRSPNDRLVAHDYTGTGNQNYLLAYRPGSGIAYIIGSSYFNYSPAFQTMSGLGGYDLKSTADQIFTYDYSGTGLQTALALYRPGAGVFYLEPDTNGQFTTINVP